MFPLPNLSFASTDASQTAVNPLAGLLSGGFAFSPQNSFGGSGNTQDSRPVVTATQTPTLAAPGAPVAPYADSFGFGGGAAVSVPAGVNLLPLLLLGVGAVVVVAILRK